MNDTIEIKLLGVLAEIAGSDCIELEVASSGEVSDLINQVIAEYPAMKLVQCQLAINQEITKEGNYTASDDLMLMPPFSGG